MSGTLATRLVIHFRARSLEEENEAQVTPAPNFGKPKEPTTAAELISAFRSIYRYYYTFAEGIRKIKEDYEGQPTAAEDLLEREKPRQARHPVIHVLEAV